MYIFFYKELRGKINSFWRLKVDGCAMTNVLEPPSVVDTVPIICFISTEETSGGKMQNV
jgi:hypothetical protein